MILKLPCGCVVEGRGSVTWVACERPREAEQLREQVRALRETVFALVGVLLEAGEPRSPLRQAEDPTAIVEETARMAAKARGVDVPDGCGGVALSRAIALGYGGSR